MQTSFRLGWAHLILGLGSGLVTALAAWLFIAPQAGPPPLFPFQDKFFHLIAFAVLAAPGVLALPPRHLWFWLAHLVALAVGVEIVQGLGGLGRSASILDVAADLAGLALALVFGRMIRRRFETPARS